MKASGSLTTQIYTATMLRLIFILMLGFSRLQQEGYTYDSHFTIAAESRMTTVIGSMDDVARFKVSVAAGASGSWHGD